MWGCWRRWRGWWVLGRRRTAARDGRRPPRSSPLAARAASSCWAGSTPGHWEALGGRGRGTVGHPGTWKRKQANTLTDGLSQRHIHEGTCEVHTGKTQLLGFISRPRSYHIDSLYEDELLKLLVWNLWTKQSNLDLTKRGGLGPHQTEPWFGLFLM